MIKRLQLHNLVLVESAVLEFGPHFNVITGETGSGKTALIEAIRLCLGERADFDLIRKGCKSAYAELIINPEKIPALCHLLEEAGLEAQQELIIRRELLAEGKSRAFINCRAVPLPLLKQIGSLLIDLIGRHAHHALLSTDSQRELLDLFAGLFPLLEEFQKSHERQKALKKELLEVKNHLQEISSNESLWRFQLEEIESAALKEGEEEELFSQYEKSVKAKEQLEVLSVLTQTLSEGPSSVITQVQLLLRQTEKARIEEASSLFREALIPLQEALRVLEHDSAEDLADPQFLLHLEERLSLIQKLKRKYGASLQELCQIQEQLNKQLSLGDTLQEKSQDLQKQQELAEKEVISLSQKLSLKRREAAKDLSTSLTRALQELNMKGSLFSIEISSQELSSKGGDCIQFYLQANSGENPGLVKEHTSGGELSRLLFAIKVLLAEKNQTSSLIFDEVDANVGGKTASLMGQQLSELGKYKQVICITHFPQVASHADHHFQVKKLESEGRTLTEIARLDSKEKMKQELLRMQGI